jgi:phosphatidate phosphatase APP1
MATNRAKLGHFYQVIAENPYLVGSMASTMRYRKIVIWMLVPLVGIVISIGLTRGAPQLKSDEHVIFFDTDAWLDAAGTHWTIPIHGWVFERPQGTFFKTMFAELLKSKYGLRVTVATRDNFDYRSSFFLVDNERGKRIRVRIDEDHYLMPASKPNGHFHAQLVLPVAQVEPFARHNWLTYTAVLPDGDRRQFTGRVRLIKPTGLSVISDIDDTIKITHITDRTRLFDYTFFQDFQAVPGMAPLYRSWAEQGVVFHFVSAGPWQLYEPLRTFLAQVGFPAATFHLKYARLHPSDTSFWNLFKPSTEIKPDQIEPLLQAYPERRFVLIGDNGEHDPEIYAALMHAYPSQIKRIYIRNVTRVLRSDAHLQATFADIAPDRWQLFTVPERLALPE